MSNPKQDIAGKASSTAVRQFDQIAGFASALSVGAASGFVASLDQINPTLQFHVGFATLFWFILGFGATFWVYRAVVADPNTDPQRRKRALTFFGVAGILAMFCCMGFALKGISATKLKEVGFGVVIAVIFISIAAFFFFKVVGFLHRDELKHQNDNDA